MHNFVFNAFCVLHFSEWGQKVMKFRWWIYYNKQAPSRQPNAWELCVVGLNISFIQKSKLGKNCGRIRARDVFASRAPLPPLPPPAAALKTPAHSNDLPLSPAERVTCSNILLRQELVLKLKEAWSFFEDTCWSCILVYEWQASNFLHRRQ